MSKVGTYRGVNWVQRRLCDVFPHLTLRQQWYFIEHDGFGGDHFSTLRAMRAHIDTHADTNSKER